MSATRVRVVFEYRNGDGHYLSIYRGAYVATDGEHDLGATNAAYLAALQSKEQHRIAISEKEQPHRD
jgi:hypothetical protein